MRHLGKLVALAAMAVVFAAPTAAYGATTQANLVDGAVQVNDTVCAWANASTNANPPSTLTVDRNTVNLSCEDGTPVTLNNSPVVSFDDTAGTATADAVDISATILGITCRYAATNVVLTREGTTRTYSGGGYVANKVSGSFLCPSTQTITSASVSFH